MESDNSNNGLRLMTTAAVGMVMVLAFVGGGLWTLAPDLEDGAPVPPLPQGANLVPNVAGAGFGSVRISPPRMNIDQADAPAEATTSEKAKEEPAKSEEQPRPATTTPPKSDQ